MFFTRHKTNLLEPEQALPGRETPLPVPGAPRRPGHPAAAAVPRGLRDRRVRHRLLLGRRARVLAGARRLHDGRRLRGRRRRRTRPTRRCAPRAPTTPRPCSSSSTPPRPPTRRCSSCSGRTTTRRRACARATTSARSTARRSTRPRRSSSRPRSASRETFQEQLGDVGLRRDHHRDRRGRAVLLRRGLPPAVPGQEPERLLRARRHRRLLPDRHRRHAAR